MKTRYFKSTLTGIGEYTFPRAALKGGDLMPKATGWHNIERSAGDHSPISTP